MMGDHSYNNSGLNVWKNGVGALASLQEMLAIVPQSPSLPADISDSIIMGMNPSPVASNVEILKDIRDENDEAPYSPTVVLGSGVDVGSVAGDQSFVTREVGWFTDTGALQPDPSGIASLPVMGFECPLGLLEVRIDGKDGDLYGVLVELVEGSYKGVHSEAY